ncbi:hypothetical protein EOD39_8054 [Acipenser ruthenus]|uniref:Uncharacterized protein n=1 Tax=Acipenser ruthenus TaxID=7906 RepID=A0A662YWU2_ACIRT|nr:hypothetical protein EOD39_8054 [Acipenser ruthenus]
MKKVVLFCLCLVLLSIFTEDSNELALQVFRWPSWLLSVWGQSHLSGHPRWSGLTFDLRRYQITRAFLCQRAELIKGYGALCRREKKEFENACNDARRKQPTWSTEWKLLLQEAASKTGGKAICDASGIVQGSGKPLKGLWREVSSRWNQTALMKCGVPAESRAALRRVAIRSL